jgi:thymidine kinase
MEQAINNQSGYLEIILGPMFSGKTSRLIEMYSKFYHLQNCDINVVNHSIDNRYSTDHMSTHDQRKIPCVFIEKLNTVVENIKKTKENSENKENKRQIILINEAQFFTDLFESVLTMVETYKCIVVLCGLDGDFQRNKFGSVLDLIPYCDKVEKLHAFCSKCDCIKSAVFSQRLTEETEQNVVGNSNYVPLCRDCYLK